MCFTIEQTTTENYYISVELETRANIDFFYMMFISSEYARIVMQH